MEIDVNSINAPKATPVLYYEKHPGLNAEVYIANKIENILFDYRLQGDSIDVSRIRNARRPVEIKTITIKDGKFEKTNTELNMGVGICMCYCYLLYDISLWFSSNARSY
jgi:hypothetical protein